MRWGVILIFLILILPLRPSYVSLNNENYNWLIEFIDENPFSAYYYAANISLISINVSLAHYSFRAAGSPGEYQVFLYIKNLLESWNLDMRVEKFSFISWDIYDEPNITLIISGENETYNETYRVYPEHYTFGTPPSGLVANVCYLPLPDIFISEPLPDEILEIWNQTNISGKIVLIGRDVFFNKYWAETFILKLEKEKPLAILYTWATIDFKMYPRFHSSNGGRGFYYYRENRIPVAWVDRSTATKIIEELNSNKTVTAILRIPIKETHGEVRNIIATIPGRNTSKTILVTAHYDSVMCPGLSDNAAGVSGVLELAWAFSRAVREGLYTPPINITFVFFTSEELGLLGSAKFVEMHKDELGEDIIGVINLDTLGSYKLAVSEDSIGILPPNASKRIYLHELVMSAATELGLDVKKLVGYGVHSDDSTFSNPMAVNYLINMWWPDLGINISDVTPIAGTMISSTPYIPWEPDEEGRSGWIHTPYDNITSTKVYDWVNSTRLETQIKVAGLALLKLLKYFEVIAAPPEEEITPETPTQPPNMMLYIVIFIVVAIIFIVSVMYSRRKRRMP